jgi:hypothetical protein
MAFLERVYRMLSETHAATGHRATSIYAGSEALRLMLEEASASAVYQATRANWPPGAALVIDGDVCVFESVHMSPDLVLVEPLPARPHVLNHWYGADGNMLANVQAEINRLTAAIHAEHK